MGFGKIHFVENNLDVEDMIEMFQTKDTLVIPILTDVKAHAAVNPLCVLCVSTPDMSFLIGFNHNETQNLNPDILLRLREGQRVWAPDKKLLEHVLPGIATHDVGSLEYLSTGKVTPMSEFHTKTHRKLYELHDRVFNVNKSVPVMTHIEYLESYIAHAWSIITDHNQVCDDRAYEFLNNEAIPALAFVESGGMCVDAELAEEKYTSRVRRFITDSKLYSEYNLFTATGRCSNKFGGINFAALNKKDGTREMYVSRFDRGLMVMADFESFHLRLIADMIGFEFPEGEAVHEYLGKQYFGVTELTPEQYDEGKQITFRLLYSEDRDTNVPEFFREVRNYVDMLMVLLNRNGHILSPYFKREIKRDRIENPTPSKVFNYMVQLAETELNLTAINKLRPLYVGKQSRPIMYTYDSLLFDFNIDDGSDLLRETIRILSHDDKFPMRVYYGTNYDNLKRVNLL
jgi:hypothetical protein